MNRGTRIGLFTDSFFDDISFVMFGFCYGFSRICKCLGTSFFGGIGVVVTLHIDISPHLASPEGEGQIVLVRLKQVDKLDSA